MNSSVTREPALPAWVSRQSKSSWNRRNPALFHGAGTNRSADVRRMADLLQVSSAFGRAMEAVDRTAMRRALYPILLSQRAAGAAERTLRNVVAAAEGYAFPTNLDRDQPIGGLAPETQAELVWRALQEEWTSERSAPSWPPRPSGTPAGSDHPGCGSNEARWTTARPPTSCSPRAGPRRATPRRQGKTGAARSRCGSGSR
jgi:hypothetical protein